MEVIFLGTGTSHGVPMIGCECAICRSQDPRNKRTRSSVHVVMDGLHIQVDAAQEFRLQCVREDIRKVDLFILTHEHADHIYGMDDLRRFCDLGGGVALDVYASPESLECIKRIYPYAVREVPLSRGYAAFRLHEMQTLMELPQGRVQTVRLPHGSVQTLGLVFTERSSGRKFTYYTDCKTLPDEAMTLAKGSDLVVLDGLRPRPHPTHMAIGEAVEKAAIIGAENTFLTHLTHDVDHGPTEEGLPPGVRLAYDGLRVKLG
jgi:phosphoribosyl 1,2-cyclic phosphate phosphodiesterase